jgi:hypothetical protein
MRRRFHGALAAVGLWLSGCGVSPQPEPPGIDITRIVLDQAGANVVLQGSPGAVTPGASVLTSLDLSSTAPASSISVAADGSFSVTSSGALDDEYRLQAFADELRSEPVDVTGVMGFVAGGHVAAAPRPLVDCFLLDPALELGPLAAGASAKVTMTNRCAGDVTVGGVTVRIGSAWSVAAPAMPIVVPVQGTASFTATYAPHPGDALDDVVFVEISAPEVGRRPITLRGE